MKSVFYVMSFFFLSRNNSVPQLATSWMTGF